VVESVDLHTQGELCSTIESLFSKDSGLITLATAHRAKGLEWPHVLHLDPWRIPSRWAKSEEALLQETNARYVIETRAKETLILADLETFK
jgi:superfamily I DNA/RNA helicase